MNLKYLVLCSIGNEARIKNVEKLKEQIPELEVVMCGRDTVFQEHIKAFDIEDEYDGIIILEDDVQLCKDFKTRATALVEEHKDEVVSMFESACSRGELKSEYRPGRNFAWNQCNYYPKQICRVLAAPDMLPKFKEYFYTKLHEVWNYPIDRYIAFVLGMYKIKYYMSVPFLVQHLPMKSNFKGRPINRQSRYFIDDMEGKSDV